MPDDDADDELGKTGEQLNGIADRFGETTDTSETSDVSATRETSETSQPGTPRSAETAETSDTGGTTETPRPGDAGFELREHWNGRTIYLPDDVVDGLDLRYKRCSIKWQEQEGGELPKNERFYPAVIRAGLNETTIEDELGLE